MTVNQYDAIIIGGGHNGLVAAAYLARAGKKVVVLERREIVGGAAVTEEIFPGFKFTEFSYVVSLLRPEIIRELELPKHGLKILPLPSTFTPMENGDYLGLWDDHDLTRRELYRHSPKDAEAYDEYARVMARAAKAIKPLISLVPPDPSSLHPRDLMGLLKLGQYAAGSVRKGTVHHRQAGDAIVCRFARGVVRDRRAQRHQGRQRHHRHLPRSALAGDSLRAAASLHGRDRRRLPRLGFCQRRLRRGQRRDCQRGESARGRDQGQQSRCAGHRQGWSRSRSRARERRGTVFQSRLLGGRSQADLPAVRRSEIFSRMSLFSPSRISACAARRASSTWRSRNCRSSRRLPGENAELHRGAVSISPSIDYIERAYDDAKYGQFSRQPYIDMIFPSMIDPDMAPPGQHVASCFVQYAPYDLEGGWDDAKKEAFAETVISTLEKYAPNIRRAIIGKQVITPVDIERIAGITGGNIFHGELLLHQIFFMRPAPGLG